MNKKGIIFLILSVVLIHLLKPNLIYKPNGMLRDYGVGYDKHGFKKTFFTLPIIIVLIVIFVNEYLPK